MRILYLVGDNDVIAGGATIRDVGFVRGLAEAGHEVEALSLYGPTIVEGETASSKLFQTLGNLTLRKLFPRLSKIPSTLADFVRNPRPVVSMTSLAVMGKRVDSRGPLAVSMLSGANMQQRREFQRLMDFLARKPGKIDVAILANTLLSGLAEPIRVNLGCPIICLSQGSDRIVEALEDPYRSDARKLVRKNARLFRMVVSTSRYFAIRAAESMALPVSRIKVVLPGIDTEAMEHSGPRRRNPFTIGYMAPIRKEKGLDILIDAVDSLLKDSPLEPMLWIGGKIEDERYWNRLHRRLDGQVMRNHHRIFGGLSHWQRRSFMEELSVFVASSREPESRATFLLEAMAAGVPVIGPATGIIPEIFQYANGGLLVSSEAPAWMFSQALELMAAMPDTADEMGAVGCRGVRENFSVHSASENLMEIIECAIGQSPSGTTKITNDDAK